MTGTSDKQNGTDAKVDYRPTILLPETDFPMRAGLPKKEPELLERWQKLDLYKRLRADAKDRPRYILHDGPPYANGHLHIGHALNKILKDVVTRSQQMLGHDSNYVPGWDCHGLPIEWKIEEQYRAKGKNKDEVPINEFRQECREFAEKWVEIQAQEFQRLGVVGDFENPYTTMAFEAEAAIAAELMKFAKTGQLYRGSKPVMWSVVEKTALAEAEIEYHDYQSDTVWVKFPVQAGMTSQEPTGNLHEASIVIWTTTPWTIPGNRAISYSPKVAYGLYEVTASENDFGPRVGEKLIFADSLAQSCAEKAKLTFNKLQVVAAEEFGTVTCTHPLKGMAGGYEYAVPLLAGNHVTDEEGTGFVHTAPGHGREDFEIWMDNASDLEDRGIDSTIPFTVDGDGFFTDDAPGFERKRVITDKGDKGDANEAVIKALIERNMLFARGRLKHQYPHSWRSKKPIIFRNTPQWFVYMDRDIDGQGDTLRARALKAIDETRFVPKAGQKRLRGMIQDRPDWVMSRQRAWGVPIAVFVDTDGNILNDETVNKRIIEAFRTEGADAWFTDNAKERFLGDDHKPEDWEQVTDILDVWFDSGSTHAFVMEARDDLKVTRPADGGDDYVLYLEGSDQHRGWFHSSLLESCGTRGRAPYDAVLTHGFTMAEDGRKMSKSLNNQVLPEKVVDQYGADILRLWVMNTDYMDDQRVGPEILKSNADAYRRLRNTIRFMLGNLSGFDESERVPFAEMPELERWMLQRLSALDASVRDGYHDFAYQKVFTTLFNFCTVDLSSFYFDIRKDTLYCEPASSLNRRACRTVLDELFGCVVRWLAPMLCFTMEEAWLARFPGETESVHLQQFPASEKMTPWRDDALAEKWRNIRSIRRVVTGALEIERADKKLGSSLEASPILYMSDPDMLGTLQGLDMAELCITSGLEIHPFEDAPADAYRLAEATDKVAVMVRPAEGEKCNRCWMVLKDVGSNPDHPQICTRCASVVA